MFYISVFSVEMTMSPYDPAHAWYFEMINKSMAKYENKLYEVLIEQNSQIEPHIKEMYKRYYMPLFIYACKRGYVYIKFDDIVYEDGSQYFFSIGARMDMEQTYSDLRDKYPYIVREYDKLEEEKHSKIMLEKRKEDRISKMLTILEAANDFRKKPIDFKELKTYTSLPYEKILIYEYEKLQKKLPEFFETWKELHPEFFEKFENDTTDIFKFFNKEEEKDDGLIRDMVFFDWVKRHEKKYFDYHELSDKILYEEAKVNLTKKERLEIYYNAYTLQNLTGYGKMEINYNKLMNLDINTLKSVLEQTCEEAKKRYPSEFNELHKNLQVSFKKGKDEFFSNYQKEQHTIEKESILNFARENGIEIESESQLSLYENTYYPYIVNYEYEKLNKHYPNIIKNWKNENLEK